MGRVVASIIAAIGLLSRGRRRNTMLALLHVAAISQNLPLPPLPYAYEALEPHIDAETMRIHHLKHHQTYTDKLNAALTVLRGDADQKFLAKMGIDKLLQNLRQISDEATARTVRNAGGGYVNHDLFFKCMAPDGGGEPDGSLPLVAAMTSAFGSVDTFRKIFSAAALELFGSGWAWLVLDTRKDVLVVTATANQDSPSMEPGMVPILGLDVWEHAYYLKHQNKRGAYIEDFWKVINWPGVSARYDEAVEAAKTGKAEL